MSILKRIIKVLSLYLFTCAAVCLFSVPPGYGEERQFELGWFSDLYQGHSFWDQHLAFTQAVAKDLGVTITPFWFKMNHREYEQRLKEVTTGENAVDGVIILNFKKQGEIFLKILDQQQVFGVTNVSGADYAESGKPREVHPYWIAEISADEEKTGFDLATTLLDTAKSKNLVEPDGKIHMLAISGHKADLLTTIRNNGLKRAVNSRDDVVLHQIIPTTYWSRQEGKEKFSMAHKRYPQVAVVWAANDDIALGVVDGVEEAGLFPGKDVITGGIDWAPEALRLVKEGKMTASIGGMFMHGGWAVILLYDYLNGNDFIKDTGVIIKTENTIITQENVDFYVDKFGMNWDDVDFARFSKTLNPDLKKYDFSLQNLFR